MSQAGPPPPPMFGQFPALPSASFATAGVSDDTRFFSARIDRIRHRIQLDSIQIPSLSPKECDTLSSGEAIIPPFLLSTIHAVSALGDRIEELFSSLHCLQSQLANSAVDTELRDLRGAVRDLSHRLPSLLSNHTQNRPSAPQPPATRTGPSSAGPPPHAPSSRPTGSNPPHATRAHSGPSSRPSYAAVIHGGTSEFDQAAAENAAKRKAKGKGSPRSGITASKVAAVMEASSPKGPPPLSAASRRFYAPRRSQAPLPDMSLIRIRLPDIAAPVPKEANSQLPVSFKSFVNSKGAVTHSIVDTSVPAASYPRFFEALTSRLNQSFPVADNPWQTFRLAPTDLQIAIHGLRLDAMPEVDALLAFSLSISINNAKAFIIKGARYLNPDCQSRTAGKHACSVVVQVAAEHGWRMTDPPLALLYGENRVVKRAYPSSPFTQFGNGWKFGHVKQRCKNPTICSLCSGPHFKSQHRCSNPSCPKEGNLKPTLNCCVVSPACGPNCGEAHSVSYRDCSARPVPPLPSSPLLPAAQAMDVLPDAPAHSRPNTPSGGLAPPIDLTTPRAAPRPPLAGPSRPSSIRTGRPLPAEKPSPSPAPRDPSASRG